MMKRTQLVTSLLVAITFVMSCESNYPLEIVPESAEPTGYDLNFSEHVKTKSLDLNRMNLMLEAAADKLYKVFSNESEYQSFKDKWIDDQLALIKMNQLDAYFRDVSYSEKYLNEDYFPAIYLYNSNYCDHELDPIIAVGTEVTTLESLTESYIMGYRISGPIKYKMFINEKQARDLKNPLYIVVEVKKDYNQLNKSDDLVEDEYLDINPEDYQSANSSIKKSVLYSAMKFSFHECRVFDRYDSNNYSEIKVNYRYDRRDLTTEVMPIVRLSLYDIHKNNIPITMIGDLNMPYLTGQYLDPTDLRDDKVYDLYAVVFEYDWFRAKETVYITYGVIIECRMRYDTDYYYKGALVVGDEYWDVDELQELTIKSGETGTCDIKRKV